MKFHNGRLTANYSCIKRQIGKAWGTLVDFAIKSESEFEEMTGMKIRIKKLHPDAIVPKYATPGAACFDLHAVVPLQMILNPGQKVTIRTGLSFEIPRGHVMLVFSRSGHGFNYDVRLANCVGVIDSDYRGEVLVKLTSDFDDYSWTKEDNGVEPIDITLFTISPGTRIAQAMIIPIPSIAFEVVEELSETERDQGGFGSTGK